MNVWSVIRDKHQAYVPLLVEWEEEFSVYNPVSGETHFLNFFPGEILRRIIEKPASLSQLSEYLAELSNEEMTDSLEQKILHILHDFEELQLIEQQ